MNENINIDKKDNEFDKNVEKDESNNLTDNNYSKQKKEKIIPKRNENKGNTKLHLKNYHSNDKIKINNIMLYKNIKNKINVNTKAIEDKEKELIKLKKQYNNLKINPIEKDTNNKSYNATYNINTQKKTWNNPIHHKNGTSLIGNNKYDKKKQVRKHKNKSMDIDNKAYNKVVSSDYLNKFNLSYILNFLIYDMEHIYYFGLINNFQKEFYDMLFILYLN